MLLPEVSAEGADGDQVEALPRRALHLAEGARLGVGAQATLLVRRVAPWGRWKCFCFTHLTSPALFNILTYTSPQPWNMFHQVISFLNHMKSFVYNFNISNFFQDELKCILGYPHTRMFQLI